MPIVTAFLIATVAGAIGYSLGFTRGKRAVRKALAAKPTLPLLYATSVRIEVFDDFVGAPVEA